MLRLGCCAHSRVCVQRLLSRFSSRRRRAKKTRVIDIDGARFRALSSPPLVARANVFFAGLPREPRISRSRPPDSQPAGRTRLSPASGGAMHPPAPAAASTTGDTTTCNSLAFIYPPRPVCHWRTPIPCTPFAIPRGCSRERREWASFAKNSRIFCRLETGVDFFFRSFRRRAASATRSPWFLSLEIISFCRFFSLVFSVC